MVTLQVVNIKCGGCQKNIVSTLAKNGFTDIAVDLAKQEVSFEGDRAEAVQILQKMGYPEASSAEAKNLLRKGLSYVSCAIGKFK